ncbi:UNKNOWN [Stylonychia lemnae]|uniref:Transmembrane protein n=1 Tax=Stylonychia lemnae TaxID=5949 RepID=A0A078AZF1_STYLE|nr:UNKNOWN [Stylonychia lemnae]|eukprot:CDW87486.1 UNKNOWN [Stylonychia lemnae]
MDFTLDYSFVTFLANAINILFVILAEAYIVEKANKCLDFTVTIFILHLWVTWYLYKFPTALQWWICHGILVTVTVLAAEFFCLKLETAEIKLSVGHILEKGKEIGKEAAQKILKKDIGQGNNRKNSKNDKKLKKKEKSIDEQV